MLSRSRLHRVSVNGLPRDRRSKWGTGSHLPARERWPCRVAEPVDERVDEGVDVFSDQSEGAGAGVVSPQRQDNEIALVMPGEPHRPAVAAGVEKDLAMGTGGTGAHLAMMPPAPERRNQP